MREETDAACHSWRQRFVNAFENAYRRLGTVAETNSPSSVLRGRAKCASGWLEDLFAGMVFENVISADDNYIVLVDWPVTAEGERQPKYHDFLLCRKQNDGCLLIVYAADLKTNSGFFRGNITTAYKSVADRLLELKEAARLSSRQIFCKEGKLNFKCSPSALYDLIIYSSVNNSKKCFDSQVDACNEQNNDSKVIVLCDFVNRKQAVRDGDFTVLEQRLRRQMEIK